MRTESTVWCPMSMDQRHGEQRIARPLTAEPRPAASGCTRLCVVAQPDDPTALIRCPQLDDIDRRALSPLFWSHINPYGRFRLDMDSRIDLTAASVAVELDGAEGNESVL